MWLVGRRDLYDDPCVPLFITQDDDIAGHYRKMGYDVDTIEEATTTDHGVTKEEVAKAFEEYKTPPASVCFDTNETGQVWLRISSDSSVVERIAIKGTYDGKTWVLLDTIRLSCGEGRLLSINEGYIRYCVEYERNAGVYVDGGTTKIRAVVGNE